MTGTRSVFRLGPFDVEPDSGEIRNGGKTERLPPQSLALLLALVEEPGRVVSREELRRRLWPDTAVEFEDGLNHAVARLREALHDSADAPALIETVPRKGYRFIGTFERLESGPGRASPVPPRNRGGSPSLPSGHTGRRRRGSNRRSLTAAAAAGLLLTGTIAWRAFSRGDGVAGIRAIAVLPLADLSPDTSGGYLGDGIMEELITDLARSDSLRVLSRTSTLRYRGSTRSAPEIAAELGVDALVEGSIQRSGDGVRVSVQLVRVAPEAHLWARSYDGGVGDLFAIRTRIAQDIVRRLGRQLPPPTHVHEPLPAAHDAVLLGRSFALQNTREGFEKSLEYFERAVAIDPRFALGFAEASESHAMLDFIDDRRGEHFERARELARRAVELAPDLGEARLREADLKFYWDWDWSQCDTAFRSARDLSPGSGDTREHYALCLLQIGRREEALREFERALEVEPLSARCRRWRGELLSRLGRSAEAVEEFRKAADLRPSDASCRRRLGQSLLDASRWEDALKAFSAASRVEQEPETNPVALEESLRRGGPAALLAEVRGQEQRRLRQELAALERRALTEWVSPLARAVRHAGLGDLDTAFELLDQGFHERCPRLALVVSEPELEPIRRDPRYAELLRRMGFPRD